MDRRVLGGGLGLEILKLGKDSFQDGRNQGIACTQGFEDSLDQVVSLHLSFLVAVKDTTQGSRGLLWKLYPLPRRELTWAILSSDMPYIWPGKARQVEAPVQYRHSLRAELLVNILGIDDHRVHGLGEAQPHISFPKLLYSIKDG